MPIDLPPYLRRVSQDEFARSAFRVMQAAFAVHDELGRFLEEGIYQRAIADRLSEARIEVPLKVEFDGFLTTYSMDLLVEDSAIFELKAVERLARRHRAQLVNYLMLTELQHGKLVNLRPSRVEHEFVNSTLRHAERVSFDLLAHDWAGSVGGACDILPWLVEALRDWGTGLDLSLYESACTHFFGGESQVRGTTEIVSRGRPVGSQPVWLAAPTVAFKITTIAPGDWPAFEDHTTRFLANSSLEAIQWMNIVRGSVRFSTFRKKSAPAEMRR